MLLIFLDVDKCLLKKYIHSMCYTVCFSCCKYLMYRTFITTTHIPEVIQLLLWAPVGNIMVRRSNSSNNLIPLFG